MKLQTWQACGLLALAALLAPAVPAQTTSTTKAAAPQQAAQAAPAQRSPWTSEPREADWVKRHEGFVERAGKGGVDVLFMGDSITDGWNAQPTLWEKNYAPLKAVNFGIGGDRTEHVLWRINQGELNGIQPKVVVLLIGTNNIYSDSAPDIAKGVTAIVDAIHQKLPKTRVLLLGVYPRNEKADDPVRAKIKQLNQDLAKLGERKYVRYLDFGDKFLAPDGTISKDIMPDFLHPNEAGYQIWIKNMNPVLKEMLKK